MLGVLDDIGRQLGSNQRHVPALYSAVFLSAGKPDRRPSGFGHVARLADFETMLIARYRVQPLRHRVIVTFVP
jgi:hypothetical protein